MATDHVVILALADICEQPGMLPSACESWAEDHASKFKMQNGRAVHVASGINALKYIDEVVRKERPHNFPSESALDLAAQSFGDRPNMTAQGKLVNEVGETQARGAARRRRRRQIHIYPKLA